MKIKTHIYAKSLVELANENDKKKVARGFLKKLRHNNQYNELHRILDLAEEDAAAKNNNKLVRIYSENEISSQDETILRNKLIKMLQNDIILKKYIKHGISGILVRYEDKIYDFSLEGKIKRLKAKITEE